jgi:heat-inducible transcriptional repressor
MEQPHTESARPEGLSERKATILRALVQQYVKSGEPVGSEVIASLSGLGVSAATIRNELAALEELGYLTHPHTSAGRIPTDRGYRHYVDSLTVRARLREPEQRAIVHFFGEALADVDEILRGTTQLLSRLTHYASLALSPSRSESSLARLELVNLGSACLLLVVFETGGVDKRVVDVPPEATDDDIEGLSRSLAERYRGSALSRARADITERAAGARDPERTLLSHVAGALSSIEEGLAVNHVVLGGVANIATEEAFQRHETLQQIFETLERETEVLGLLREAVTSPMSVTIGGESVVTGRWDASIVAAPYGLGDRALGTIGVVGPTRMDYAAAIAAVRAVAERLSAAVEALSS